jgi:hypothetical protein
MAGAILPAARMLAFVSGKNDDVIPGNREIGAGEHLTLSPNSLSKLLADFLIA